VGFADDGRGCLGSVLHDGRRRNSGRGLGDGRRFGGRRRLLDGRRLRRDIGLRERRRLGLDGRPLGGRRASGEGLGRRSRDRPALASGAAGGALLGGALTVVRRALARRGGAAQRAQRLARSPARSSKGAGCPSSPRIALILPVAGT